MPQVASENGRSRASSFRGAQELLEAVFHYRDLSPGRLHHLFTQAVDRARQGNASESLSAIRVGAQDEIYQARQPVLVGMDVASPYCYLRQGVEHCDETTRGISRLELREGGLHLDYPIADGGRALRASQRAAWGDLPCHGDVFHPVKRLVRL